VSGGATALQRGSFQLSAPRSPRSRRWSTASPAVAMLAAAPLAVSATACARSAAVPFTYTTASRAGAFRRSASSSPVGTATPNPSAKPGLDAPDSALRVVQRCLYSWGSGQARAVNRYRVHGGKVVGMVGDGVNDRRVRRRDRRGRSLRQPAPVVLVGRADPAVARARHPHSPRPRHQDGLAT
jgi:hypothetical protein